MKKVIMISKNVDTGGIESSFSNFLIQTKNHINVDIFLNNNNGALKHRLPTNIRIFEGNKIIKSLSGAFISSNAHLTPKAFKFKSSLRNFIKFIVNVLHVKGILKWFGLLTTKKIKGNYDCALCFYAQNDICTNITLKKIKAKQKFAFIHCDVSKFDIGKKIEKQLMQFNKIICVSNSCAKVFKTKYPDLANKVDYLYNFQDSEKIKNLSNEYIIKYPNTFNIVTVSRLSELEKGYTRSLNIFKKLHDDGYKFHWHIVGDGGDKKLITNHMKTNKMDGYVTFYGNKANPYPYVKAADLFYLGSYHEAAPMVYGESAILGVPVLSTNTCSAKELIGNRGIVCENSENDIYNSLKNILSNPDLLTDYKSKLILYHYNNDLILEKLLNLIEE